MWVLDADGSYINLASDRVTRVLVQPDGAGGFELVALIAEESNRLNGVWASAEEARTAARRLLRPADPAEL